MPRKPRWQRNGRAVRTSVQGGEGASPPCLFPLDGDRPQRCGHTSSCGVMMVTDPETFPLLSHLLLTHILGRGGIPRTFRVRHESIPSIPTYSFSVRYRAREKPNDLLESPAATGIPVRASAAETPRSLGGGGSRAPAALPAP